MDELIEMYKICEAEGRSCGDCDSCAFKGECFLIEELEDEA